MQRIFLRLSLAVLAYISFFITGCTKIDTTELGADLLPAVDNVLTFADTLDVNGTMGSLVDTIRLSRTETHVLGRINDPVFGNTNADIFLQLKPGFFPYFFGNAKDTFTSTAVPGARFDSVILCLSYRGFYGDTTVPQNIKVYELDPNTSNFIDSISYKLDFQPDLPYSGNLVGQASIRAADLRKQIVFNHGKDSVVNQVRIRLSNSFVSKLSSMDSTGANNAYKTDSLFKTFFKGFAVVSDNSTAGSGGLFQISLVDPLTRLEVHFTRTNGTKDTTYSSFSFSQGTTAAISPSAQANYVKRNAGSEFPNSPAADALYIQSTPGSSIYLAIPELTNYPNRIIHRAELFLEQIPGDPAIDKVLTPPAFLYLDLVDTSSNGTVKYKPIYYDLSPNTFYNPDDPVAFFPQGGVDHNYFGGFLRTTTDAFGTRAFYTFNLTRYVQNMITKHGINYKLRVNAPYKLSYYGLNLLYSNQLAAGRVKLANGTHNNYKLRMRIVYSDL